MSRPGSKLWIFGEWIVQGVAVQESLSRIKIWRGGSKGCSVRWWIGILDMIGNIQKLIRGLSSTSPKGMQSKLIRLFH